MRKQVMVLVDSEEGYAERFKDFVNRKKTSPYQLRAFSDPGLMNAYFQMHRAEVLLISEADYGKEKLKAEVPVRILLSDKCHGRSGEELPTIWKYQPVSAILKGTILFLLSAALQIMYEPSRHLSADVSAG